MKTTDMSNTGDQSCSCTSCMYKSEADHPSLRRIISQGTRIDRLYYGKYIPLRERKLLEKLVRTRGVYDDIRARLLSNSTISLESKAVCKPYRKIPAKKIKKAQYSKEILELVDLVDKGEKLGSKELSGCCSYCTCSSKYNIHSKYPDKQRPKRAYPGANRRNYIKDKIGDYKKRGVRFKTKHIKSDPCTCTYKFSGMLKHQSKATPKKGRGYRPVPLADINPTTDEEINQRPPKNSYLSILSNENLQQSKTQLKELMMVGVRRLSESKEKIQEKIDLHEKKSLEKLSKLKNNIKTKIKIQKVPQRNNINICNCPEKDLVMQIKKDSISKFKDDLKRKKILKDWECYPECIKDSCIPEKCYLKLKHKRSRRKHHINNKGNISNQDKKNRQSLIKPIIKVQSKQISATMPIKITKQKPILRAQQTREMDNPWLNFTNDKKKIHKEVKKDVKKKNQKKGHKSHVVKSGTLVPGFAALDKKLNIAPPRENESRKQIARIGSSFNFNIEFYKNKIDPSTDMSQIKLQRLPDIKKQSPMQDNFKPKTGHRRQRGSQIKLKYTMKNTKTGDDNSKRCMPFCPLKLKSKRKKPKSTTTKESLSTFNTITDRCTSMNCATKIICNLKECKKNNLKLLNNVETNAYYRYQKIINLQKKGQKSFKKTQILLPYECEPNVCLPDICDPYQCIQLINNRNAKTKEQSMQCNCLDKFSRAEKTKSTSSLTSMSYAPLKPTFVKSMTTYKSGNVKNKVNKMKKYKKGNKNQTTDSTNGGQVVRIGSNFSFNLEFYKTKYPHPLSSPNINILSTRTNVKSHKMTGNKNKIGDQTATPINNHLYKKAGIGTTLKRCFCTLKIQERKKTKKKKMATMGTNIVNDMYSNAVVTYNKSTKTKNNEPVNYFEYKPFVCIPGVCDPYECLDRLNRKRLKEVGSITDPSKNVSVSSTTYSKKSLKAIQIQSKSHSKDRKTSAKTKNITSQLKEYLPSGNTNQTVKVGSSISFNIEFFKTGNKINSIPHIDQKTKMRSRTERIDGTRKGSKLNVANITSQAKQKAKHNKSFMAGHLIKRCFCTLNLQKYRQNQHVKQEILTVLKKPSKFPREYTVNRATTRLNPIFTCEKPLNDCILHSNKNSNIRSSNRHLQTTQCQESLTVIEKKSQCYSLSNIGDDTWASNISFIEERLMALKETKVTNLTQYVRQCFCTMNLQLINKNISGKNPKPAVRSVTGKRMKEFTKGDKSAVQVGSNFNFNIEFSKNLSSPKYSSNTEIDKPIKGKSKKVKSNGTKRHNDFNRQSQSSANKLVHKGSVAMPVPKRCFCTLKLHKMGRKYMKNSQNQVNVPDIIPKTPNNTINRGQNTDFKPMKIAQSLKPYECEPNICMTSQYDPYQCLEIMKRKKKRKLDPYECEPNICIPGQCDPYQCLEIMNRKKRTKESGIVTIQTKKSASSITTDNHSKGTQKIHQKKMKTKENSAKLSQNTFESDVLQPSRQVVRVGSNFSFNIEFFKDQVSPVETQNVTKDFKDKKQIKHGKYISKLGEKGIGTPIDSKFKRHKDTEIEKSPNRIASTMTSSLIKRCFCTAQLRKDTPTFLKKCFCLFKSKKPNPVKNEGIHISKVPHVDKKINTNKITLKEHQLLPYECEPGICVPGECNPYECEKFLQTRKMRTKSKLSGTAEFNDFSSVSSNTQKLKMKNVKIQMKKRPNVKAIKAYSVTQSSPKHTDRQVVRIGSNFSFNIEFYKNKSATHPVKVISKRRKEAIRKKLNKQESDVIETRSQRSQVVSVSKMDRSTEQNHFLKRCFCTLQLHNQYSSAPKENIQKKKTNKGIKSNTKSVMTKTPKNHIIIRENYECPPDICVPNQCDPYECEKIIKMRRKQLKYKEFGMSTRSPKKSTVSSTTPSMRKYKQRTQTIGHKKYNKNTNYNTKFKAVNSKQRVKIGSSFEFNIEFSKNKTNQGLEINKPPKLTHMPKHQTKRKVSNANTQMHKQVKFAKIGDIRTQSQSTIINISPRLKRCFCTLFMKSAKIKQKPIKKTTSNIGTETPKPFVANTSSLLPYECEPQTCIPGECDPVKCLERIKKRNKHFGVNTNYLQRKSTAGTMTPGKAKFKTKKNQFTNGEFQAKKKRNLNKQAVRIGSNFSFNIEFYKGNNSAPYNHPKETLNKIEKNSGINKSDSKGDQLQKSVHNAKTQMQKKACDVSTCPKLKKMPKEKQTYVNNSPTFLKRCFCVLKLQKLRNRRKHAATSFDPEIQKHQELPLPRSKNIAIQQILPYECEPNVCIPGQCDPYECQKRIMARELCIRNKCDKKCYMTQKSQNICTQINNPCSDKCIGIKADEYKIRKNKSSLASSVTTNRTVNDPIYTTNLNKQAVKIGSNFSFNIEFYKKGQKTMVPRALEHIESRSPVNNVHNKNIITKSAFIRNRGSQAKVITTKNKTLDEQNELNRCFCTLKLQKHIHSKYRNKNLNSLSKPPQYPQAFEVRRVAVQPISKIPANKKNVNMRSVSTRIHEKYMKENQNICPCKDSINPTEMKTILPFTPKKFKDTSSKTFFPVQKEIKCKKYKNEGVKLKKKKNKRYIDNSKKVVKENESKGGSFSNIKNFLCRCAAVFSKKQKNDTLINTADYTKNNHCNKNSMYNNDPEPICGNICFENLRSSKSDRRPVRQFINQNTKVRKSKSLKLYNPEKNQKKTVKESNKVKKSSKPVKVANADNNGITFSIKQNKKNDGVLCAHCQTKIDKNKGSLPPLKVHFDDRILKLDSVDETKSLKKPFKSLIKQHKKDGDLKESENCESCNSCGRILNKAELQKAGGDRSTNESNKNQKYPQRLIDMLKHKNVVNTVQNESPLFEMQLNSDDFDIINKDEVIGNVTKLSKRSVNDNNKLTKPHKKSCRCCICLGKKKTHITTKSTANKPCTCGSYICSKKSHKIKKDSLEVQHRKQHWKPCVCGSPICDRESAAIRAISTHPDKITCICKIEKRKKKQKLKEANEKKESERRAIVMKKRIEEDRIRRKHRAQLDKEMEKRINKNSSDIILAAESIIDIGKLGITACTDILRSVARCTSDPKQAYYTLKAMKDDPTLIAHTMKSVIEDSGVVATAKRVRLRCLAMRGVKTIKNTLERYAITNFLLHIADKDPKRRALKAKMPTRLREQIDFGCSLYMGSLRKRPYLSVYNRCPWFYPHFLSLVNVWKQFTDIMLFLLAVVFWSPCILCMEACRAIMCCFFCTG